MQPDSRANEGPWRGVLAQRPPALSISRATAGTDGPWGRETPRSGTGSRDGRWGTGPSQLWSRRGSWGAWMASGDRDHCTQPSQAPLPAAAGLCHMGQEHHGNTAWHSRTCAGTGTQCGAPGLVRHAGRAAISWRGHGRDEVCKIQDTEGCRQHVWIPAIGTVLGCVFPALLPWAVPCLTRSRRSLSCSTFYSQSGAGQCQPSAMHWAEHSEPLHIEGFPQLAQFLLVP